MCEVGVSAQTVADWSSFCREVWVYWLKQQSQVLSGPGVVVKIDEAKIGRRKYNRGWWVKGNWVFAGTERSSGWCFILRVPNRRSDTFLSVIQNWFRPGTTIMSDCWKVYDCLSVEGFVHQTVNHSHNFIDPRSAVHTHHIKRVWREVCCNIPHFGRKESHMVGYLAEFLFKQKYPNKPACCTSIVIACTHFSQRWAKCTHPLTSRLHCGSFVPVANILHLVSSVYLLSLNCTLCNILSIFFTWA